MSENDRLPYVTTLLMNSAHLFAERNAVYKDNFRVVGKVMKALFPEGIELKSEEDHNKFHLFMLAIVKLTRYAINYKEGHKDSIEDLIVYCAMVAALDHEKEGSIGSLGEAIQELTESIGSGESNIFADIGATFSRSGTKKPEDASKA